MLLTRRFESALTYAARLHRRQHRKGTTIPYVAHLLAVTALVLEHGGDEDQGIAALLHDAVEDQGGARRLQHIRRTFGDRVAGIVRACSDSATGESGTKAPWRPRKEAYLQHLREAPAEARLVSAADKLHNARAILADYKIHGESLWKRFTPPREEILWYYKSLVGVFRERGPQPLARALAQAVAELEGLVRQHPPGVRS